MADETTIPTSNQQLVIATNNLAQTFASSIADLNTGVVDPSRMPGLTGDVTSTTGTVVTTIAVNVVTNAKMAQMAQSTIKGRAAGAGTGDPVDLTATQATAILNAVVGDSGAGGTKGLVPAPSAGDAAANKFLKADGTFAAISSPSETVNAQTGTTYTVLSSDWGKNVTFSNTSAIAVTVPQATGSFGSGYWVDVQNINSGLVTLTPTTSTINGAASLILPNGYGLRLISDGTNWQINGFSPLKGRVLVSNQVVSGGSEIADTACFTSTFAYYDIVFEEVTTANNAVTIQFEVYTGGAYLTAANSYSTQTLLYSGGGGATTQPATYVDITCGNRSSNTVGKGLCGNLRIYNPSSTTVYKKIQGQFTVIDGGNSTDMIVVSGTTSGSSGVTTAVTGCRIRASSGNITGTMKIYGIN